MNEAPKIDEESKPSVQVLTAEEALTLDDVEANLKQLRAELHEAKSRNIYLYNLVEEQKRYVTIRSKNIFLNISFWELTET